MYVYNNGCPSTTLRYLDSKLDSNLDSKLVSLEPRGAAVLHSS